MKKWMSFLLLALTLILAVGAAAEDMEPVYTIGGAELISAEEVVEGQVYQSELRRVGYSEYSWYYVTMPEDGQVVLYVQPSPVSGTVSASTASGKTIAHKKYEPNEGCALVVDAYKDERVYFNLYFGGWDKKTVYTLFTICFSGTHVQGEYPTTVLHATCTAPGREEYYCTICQQVTQANELPIIAHEAGEWKTEIPADCEHDGLAVQRCAVCEQELANREIAALGHMPSEKVTVSQASCLETFEILIDFIKADNKKFLHL